MVYAYQYLQQGGLCNGQLLLQGGQPCYVAVASGFAVKKSQAEIPLEA
eukprot:CAMPEP_0197631132 /NCGR_PEP_ID=MMETSP1338-20131121/8406_1 /TAXON_ID=43686 ORGANISM="Pelagodinium beii, Strain RCC1491" /NCGR_SAMPLE_ID=MMETSP1338 /ASSEMBLY_ACC=CAM_ASM_000754 /LENGTH=47 /DNA_ID= /DNA_START= /DNA_END= /DNA_ORIENTATION=